MKWRGKSGQKIQPQTLSPGNWVWAVQPGNLSVRDTGIWNPRILEHRVSILWPSFDHAPMSLCLGIGSGQAGMQWSKGVVQDSRTEGFPFKISPGKAWDRQSGSGVLKTSSLLWLLWEQVVCLKFPSVWQPCLAIWMSAKGTDQDSDPWSLLQQPP